MVEIASFITCFESAFLTSRSDDMKHESAHRTIFRVFARPSPGRLAGRTRDPRRRVRRAETGLRLSGVGLRSSAGCDETTERLSDDADGDWSAWWLVSRLLMSTACASR